MTFHFLYNIWNGKNPILSIKSSKTNEFERDLNFYYLTFMWILICYYFDLLTRGKIFNKCLAHIEVFILLVLIFNSSSLNYGSLYICEIEKRVWIFKQPWQKFRKGIQSIRIRAIPKSVFEPFRIIPKNFLNLVWCKWIKVVHPQKLYLRQK